MTAPVVDRIAPAPAPRRGPPPGSGAPLRVLRPEQTRTEADERRLVRQIAIVATIVAALCVFGVVVFHVVLTQNQFRLESLRDQGADREAEYDRLRLQVAELESPERIIAEAQQRLGMITPPDVIYLTPSIDQPSVTGDSAPPPTAEDRSTRVGATSAAGAAGAKEAGTGWSTVKPHLAHG